MAPKPSSPEPLDAYMARIGQQAKAAAQVLRLASTAQRNDALEQMADAVIDAQDMIINANKMDEKLAQEKGLSDAMIDRLVLNDTRVKSIASGLRAIAALPDPVGAIDEEWTQPNGLKFAKVRVPIGVIGMIYESRPNVTADAGALCVKSGNGVILRGGSEAKNSNLAIHKALLSGLSEAALPEACVQYIDTTDRAAVGHLLGGLNGAVDLIIPRGGKNLIARVQTDARVPVLAHLEGLCHTYVHKDALRKHAQNIVFNAKLRRTGVCGSTETLLIDRDVAADFLPAISQPLIQSGCEIRGDKAVCVIIPNAILATEEDYRTEHLAPILNIKIVDDIDAALAHISAFGSGHTDCIITENAAAAERFLRDVDSAICMHNASTQFADGGEFGFGAEIGIATGRLHARGPVGAKHLTTFKYQLRGQGHIRP